MPKHGSIILYVHGNQKVREDGQLRTATSTLTQLLNYGGGKDAGSCKPSAVFGTTISQFAPPG